MHPSLFDFDADGNMVTARSPTWPPSPREESDDEPDSGSPKSDQDEAPISPSSSEGRGAIDVAAAGDAAEA